MIIQNVEELREFPALKLQVITHLLHKEVWSADDRDILVALGVNIKPMVNAKSPILWERVKTTYGLMKQAEMVLDRMVGNGLQVPVSRNV